MAVRHLGPFCNKKLFCHNDSSVFCDANHVFDLCRKSVVFCINGPVIIFINEEFRTPSLIIGSMVKIIPGTRSISLPFGVT